MSKQRINEVEAAARAAYLAKESASVPKHVRDARLAELKAAELEGTKAAAMFKEREVREEFSTHTLSGSGSEKALAIREACTEFLNKLEELCGSDGREMALVRTKLQESSFYAVRAMATREENQDR